MSSINDLIATLCPDGVELQALGDVGEFIRGRRITKNDFVESGVGCIHYGEIYTKYGTTATETFSFVRPELAARLRLARSGDLIIAATGENAEEVCKAVTWLGADEIAIHDDCYMYRHSFDPTYISYVFQSSVFHDQKIRFAAGAKMVRVSGEKLARIRVPVPPLEVQREIVEVLKAFESLTLDLEKRIYAELHTRRTQHEHYRAEILGHDVGRLQARDWPTLEALVSFTNGKPHERFVVDGGDITLITSRFVSTGGRSVRYTDSSHALSPAMAGDIALVMSDLPNGRALARCYHVEANGKYTANQRVCLLRVVNPESTDARYLYHFLNRNPQLLSYDNHQYQTHLKKGDILSVAVPPMTITEQRRVARVLDELEVATTGLSSSLQAELRGRRQQYEYYRDRLLSFDQTAP